MEIWMYIINITRISLQYHQCYPALCQWSQVGKQVTFVCFSTSYQLEVCGDVHETTVGLKVNRESRCTCWQC